MKEGHSRLYFSTSKLLARDPQGWHTRESNGKWRHGGDCVPRCRLARYVSNRLQSLHFSPRFLAMIKNVFASRLGLLSVTHTSRRLRKFFTYFWARMEKDRTIVYSWWKKFDIFFLRISSWNKERERDKKILFKLLASSVKVKRIPIFKKDYA